MDAFAVQYYAILVKPLICLLVVGLAVPFAVAGVRTNPMVGASKALGLFFCLLHCGGHLSSAFGQPTLPAAAAWPPGLPVAAIARAVGVVVPGRGVSLVLLPH